MKLLLLSFGVVPKNSIYKFQGKKKMIKMLLSLTQLRMCEAKILFIYFNQCIAREWVQDVLKYFNMEQTEWLQNGKKKENPTSYKPTMAQW